MFSSLLWLVSVMIGVAAAQHLPERAHETRPTGVWVMPQRGPGTVAQTACRSHVVRDGYRSIQVNVDAWGCNIPGDAANEPSIAISLVDPRKMVIGWRQFDTVESDFRQAGWAYSHDGGHSWVFPGSVKPGVFASDPVLASDADGRFFYHSLMCEPDACIGGYLFRSTDGGISWPNRSRALDGDKPWMTIDRTQGIGRNNIYACADSGLARSVDGGRSFVVTDGYCWGGTVTVDPVGRVFTSAGYSNFTDVARSSNANDASVNPTFELDRSLAIGFFTARGGPNPLGLLGQAWIATAPVDGYVYVLWLACFDPTYADPADIIFVRSTDGGETWNRPVVVNDDPLSPTSWQWFNTMSVAPNGRIDVVWNDTRNTAAANLSELYYSYSIDHGATWSPNVPVSPVFDSHVGWPGGNNKLGDYYHMVSDNLGVNVAYAATFNGEQDIYFLRIGPWDCNGNEIDDAMDISEATSHDCNANDVPDECEYRVDVDGDGLTTLSDFAAFRAALTGPGEALSVSCRELLDPDHDADADLHDLYLLQHVFVEP